MEIGYPLFDLLFPVLYLLTAIAAGAHAVLNKRDPRSAWGWIAICWLLPVVGPLLYYFFGMNRIGMPALRSIEEIEIPAAVDDASLPRMAGTDTGDIRQLARIGQAVSGLPLLAGNQIIPLHSGEEAYPAMLEAIAGARTSISLATYIYHDDEIGRRFADALAAAQARGVRVKVLLDGFSDFVYRPRASRLLARRGVPSALFLPLGAFWSMLHLNLRNHRKILVVDGEVAFTGGINIADYHFVHGPGRNRVQDLHFCIRGPVARQFEDVFATDWLFATGKEGEITAMPAPGAGTTTARVVRDGPDDEINRLELLLQGALSSAHRRVLIMTPYLVPGAPILSALQSAALRGVEVRILIPERSDQPWVDWATRHLLWQLLQTGVQVRLRGPPFAHSKLFVLDGYYAQVGTANMDARSLRLNFELLLEAYDAGLAATLERHFEDVWGSAARITLATVENRPLPARVRDGLAWLFSPYL